MKRKYEKAVKDVLQQLDKFIHETLLGKTNGRRAWLVSKYERGSALPMFKVYARIPLAASLLDEKGFAIRDTGVTSTNTLDIATIESFPTKEGMGSLFLDEVEKIPTSASVLMKQTSIA